TWGCREPFRNNVCCFEAYRARVGWRKVQLEIRSGDYGYTLLLTVDDPHPKRSLADDPNFLASLGDLDRGMAYDEGPPEDMAPLFEEQPTTGGASPRATIHEPRLFP